VRTQLLCTFTNESQIDETIEKIQKEYQLFTDMIFILKLDDDDKYIITYNVMAGGNFQFLKDTILVHRKKETNTLYTINSLNNLIRDLNYGELDNSFIVDWGNYQNSVILSDGGGYRVIGTQLHNIFRLN